MDKKTKAQLIAEVEALRARLDEAARRLAERPPPDRPVPVGEQRAHLILEHINEIVYAVATSPQDPFGGRVTFVGGRTKELVGHEPGDFLRDPGLWLQLVHPDDRPALAASTTAIFSSRKPGTRTYRLRHNDTGEYRWMEDTVAPQVGEGGRVVGIFGVARDVTERRQAEEAARALAQVGRVLAETLDLDQATDRVVTVVLQFFRVRHAALFQLAGGSEVLTCVAAAGAGDPAQWINRTFPPGAGIAGLAVAQARPVWSPDLLADPRVPLPEWVAERLREEGYRSVAGAPLILHGKMLGALVLYDAPGRVFTGDDLALLAAFAGQAALALEKARLYGEAERRRREAEVLAELGGTINASLDVETVLRRVVEGAKELCGSDLARIALRDPGSESMTFRYGAGTRHTWRERVRIEAGKGAGGLVLATGRPFRTDNYAEDPRITKEHLATATAEGIVALMSAPVRIEGRIDGLLNVANRSPRPFSKRDEEILLRLADHAAIAIRNSRLFAREHAARATAEASEQRFRNLVQTLDAIVWEAVVPAEGVEPGAGPRRFTFVSQRAEALLGYPVASWLDAPDFWPAILHPDERDRVVAACTAATAAGDDFELEYRVVASDGRLLTLRDIIRVVPDGEGGPRRLRGVMVDVSTSRRAEERQALQFAVTRVLAESATLREATSTLLRVMCHGTGWALGEMWGLTADGSALACETLWHVADLPAAEFEAVTRATTLAPGVGLPGRVWAGGRPVWVTDVLADTGFVRAPAAATLGLRAALALPIQGRGQVVGVMIFFSRDPRPPDEEILRILADIGTQVGQFSERKKAEEERARLASALEQAAESIVITTTDGTIVYVNPAFERTTGYAAAEALGRTPRLLKSDRHNPAFYAELWQTICAGQTWHMEIVNRRKDGSLFTEQKSISPVKNERGETTHFVSIGQDVTARKELEAQLLQAQKMEAIGQLAGGVAHDFNNLLSIILGYSDLLLRSVSQGHLLRQAVTEIKGAADRAAALTNQLLAFSRRQVLAPKHLDLNAVVADTEKMLRRLIGEDIELVTRPGPALGTVYVDPTQVQQAFMNLAVNARDAMPQGGRITIETANVELDEAFARQHPGARPGPHVMLAVGDTGHGMDAETLAHVFEPFFTTKAAGLGTGLGLSTVYSITKQHQGYIDVESAPGRGATFRIYLPRAQGAAAPSAPAPPPALALPRGSETVLLVEDEAAVRNLLRRVLVENGYTVLEASDPADALRIGERHDGPIHLLLTDVVMPQMSGAEVAQRLTALRPALRVLYISGYTHNAISHHGVLDPGKVLLQKPFTPEVLARKVREVLDAPAAGG